MTEYIEILIYGTVAFMGYLSIKKLDVHKKNIKEVVHLDNIIEQNVDWDLNINEDDFRDLPEPAIHLFECCVTLDVIREPIIDKYGFSYDYKGIVDWVKEKKSCPINREPLCLMDLRKNISLEYAIKYFILLRKYNKYV